MPYLPKGQQALAPLDNIGVGRILQDKVEGIGDEAPHALRAKRIPVPDGPRPFLMDELPAALAWISMCSVHCSKHSQQALFASTCGMPKMHWQGILQDPACQKYSCIALPMPSPHGSLPCTASTSQQISGRL